MWIKDEVTTRFLQRSIIEPGYYERERGRSRKLLHYNEMVSDLMEILDDLVASKTPIDLLTIYSKLRERNFGKLKIQDVIALVNQSGGPYPTGAEIEQKAGRILKLIKIPENE